MKCVFCYEEIPRGARRWHDECKAEWERRYDEGRCTMCGVEHAARPHRCRACITAKNPQYRGYPGGGQRVVL